MRKPFCLLSSVVFGGAGEDEIKGMIKDGGPVKRIVFLDAGSNEVIGVTKHGKSRLTY